MVFMKQKKLEHLPITETRKKLLEDYIKYITKIQYIPSLRDFSAYLGFTPAAIKQHMDALQKAGYIRGIVYKGSVMHHVPTNISITASPIQYGEIRQIGKKKK